MQTQEIEDLIAAGIPGCRVEVSGDGTHFEAVIVSDRFAGETPVQRHQTVYRALGAKMGGEVHALSMQTYTPEEWEQRKNLRVL
jgi:acid stress-induced BolA-like protein IbaG/YrbA